MDGSVLWGHGKHAIAIANDFERVLARIPGDGPMLKWVENLISMAEAAYTLFKKQYESTGVLQSKTQHRLHTTSVSSTHDTNTNTFQPLQLKSDHVPPLVPLSQGVMGHLFAVDRDGEITESDSDLGMEHLGEPDANSSAVIGDCHDNPSDAAHNNNNQILQSQQSLKPKCQVIKSQLFINDDDDDYDHDGGINGGGIGGGGINSSGIDGSGINGSMIIARDDHSIIPKSTPG
ncbi:hypothetical protein BS47DRAFT_1393747 [Hydnum rufescens UP504]|uniref:Uncharacterized protein n=1 Tax=Hydnum rufescens UP504 TaxID=1448309 RepID=A0A9P6AWA7_9AGAM|nr:hypothetical protein BS47DRAFT_1393747 [Hydnum rufescens UP504]